MEWVCFCSVMLGSVSGGQVRTGGFSLVLEWQIWRGKLSFGTFIYGLLWQFRSVGLWNVQLRFSADGFDLLWQMGNGMFC